MHGKERMRDQKPVVVGAAKFVRRFSHYRDVALKRAVIVTKRGKPHNALISVEEYDRLERQDLQDDAR